MICKIACPLLETLPNDRGATWISDVLAITKSLAVVRILFAGVMRLCTSVLNGFLYMQDAQ